MTRPRLLIVDDEPINIQALYGIFRGDHEIYMATSGEQALEYCLGNRLPDLILLDVLMPGIGGHEVCRQLKADALTADIPVIFVTAQMAPEDETLALESGGVDFISKPVNPAVVRARVRTHLTLKAQSDMLRSLAFRDGLLGIANRRRFDEALQTEWRACRRASMPLSLLMIDVDHFKRFNDQYGHLQGDSCLQAVARTMQQHIFRAHDLLARYGGEEFACLLPDCSLVAAMARARLLCEVVAGLAIEHAGSSTVGVVTISIGVTCMDVADDCTADELLACADAALYQAKSEGRNRVCSRPLPRVPVN